MAKKINITAQLNAATTDGILADAGQIFDTKKGKFQEQVNEEFEDALEEAITSEDTGVVVESIEDGIVHNALRKNKQILTEAEKYQARHNISAITAEEAEKIAQDKINESAVSSPDKLQAVKELSSWLESNPDNAATMNAAIQDNYADIQRLYRGTGIDEYSQFSTGMDYAAGDVVLYDGVLFRFKVEHAKGAWDYNEVEEWSEKKEREEKVAELGQETEKIKGISTASIFNLLKISPIALGEFCYRNGYYNGYTGIFTEFSSYFTSPLFFMPSGTTIYFKDAENISKSIYRCSFFDSANNYVGKSDDVQEYTATQDGWIAITRIESQEDVLLSDGNTSEVLELKKYTEKKISELDNTVSSIVNDTPTIPHKKRPFYINASGKWSNADDSSHYIIPVNVGDLISAEYIYQYAWLTSDTLPVAGISAPFLEGTERIIVDGSLNNVAVPTGVKYMYALIFYNFIDYSPRHLTINGVPLEKMNYGVISRLTHLENNITNTYPKGFLKYDSTNKLFQFFMYRGVGNEYFSVTIKLMADNSDEVYLKEYRWIDGGRYSFDGNNFTRLSQTMISSENEMAIHFRDCVDYTGGFHGDERIDIDKNSYAKFFVDGHLLTEDELSSDFEIKCACFSYLQYSTLHETSKIKGQFVAGHPIIAHHLKHNIFQNCSSHLEQSVKFDIDSYDYSNLKIDQYHAIIACIAKDTGTSCLLPDHRLFENMNGSERTYFADNLKASRAILWNPEVGVKTIVEGHILEGLGDEPNGFSVWDRETDSKIYRRYYNLTQEVTKGYVIRNTQDIFWY